MKTRLVPAAVLAAASLALTAGPAVASQGSGSGGTGGGGTGGGGQTQPAPTSTFDAWSLCPEFQTAGTTRLADGTILGANIAPSSACLIFSVSPTGVLGIYDLRVAPGWVADIKSAGGGNSNKIDVLFNNPATGEKHQITMQPGKTAIR